jgi:hypothetical protein
MLKSSSLCLYSSNLGTFWLKIEQFWPFEEISIFSNSSLLNGGLLNTILKVNNARTIPVRFGSGLLLKITISFIVFCWFILSQNELKF